MNREPNVTTASQHHIRKLLEPIKNDHTSAEYTHQLKVLFEFDKRLRSLESLYQGLHHRVIQLEKKINVFALN